MPLFQILKLLAQLSVLGGDLGGHGGQPGEVAADDDDVPVLDEAGRIFDLHLQP